LPPTWLNRYLAVAHIGYAVGHSAPLTGESVGWRITRYIIPIGRFSPTCAAACFMCHVKIGTCLPYSASSIVASCLVRSFGVFFAERRWKLPFPVYITAPSSVIPPMTQRDGRDMCKAPTYVVTHTQAGIDVGRNALFIVPAHLST